MYRRALHTLPTSTSRLSTKLISPNTGSTPCSARPRFYLALTRRFSTPVQTPDDRREANRPLDSSTTRTEDAEQTRPTHALEEEQSTRSGSSPEVGGAQAGLAATAGAEQLKTRFKEWSHGTLKGMRERGDEFTAGVARTFAQLGREVNRVTGYDEIEVLKRKVVEQEAKIYHTREAARRAKDAYDTAVLQRAKSQREVNDLLQRKSHWTDEDVSRFTTLVREDHAREHDEARAKADAAAAEDAVEREFSELMRVILSRYHEEQAWSDKIRSASTYGQLAVLALNLAVFVLAIVLVEPWKRRRLAQTFERKVEEMAARMEAAMGASAEALSARMDEQERMLRAALEMVHLATQVSSSSEIAAGERDDHAMSVSTATGPAEDERIPGGKGEELVVAVTASAAVAGVIGWMARSWFG